MHIDARKLENNSEIVGDICIVGAGAAGVSIALDWESNGYKVILLEGGGFEYDDRVQELYQGTSTGQRYFPLKSCRLHYFGGTTGHWAGMCSPFDDIDFKKRDWVPNSGWPISRDELDPYYAKANKVLQLGPYEYDYSYWKEQLPNMNPFPFDSKVIWNKMWQYSLARFGEIYKDPVVASQNIHLYTYANVVDIVANENISNVDHVVIKNYEGKTHTVRAKQFILACGAIQNSRMLLASNTQDPNGLGNEHDVVGRYFMEHIEVDSSEVWLIEPFPTDLYTWNFGETKASAELAITEEAQTRYKILNGTASFSPLSFKRLTKSTLELWADDDPRKSLDNLLSHWEQAAESVDQENTGAISRAYSLMTRIEQAPNPNSRVTLLDDRDELGVPKVNLHWELTELDKYSIRKIHSLIGQQAGAAGIGRVKLKEFLWDEKDDITWPSDTKAGWHHMGTTRMGTDPKKSVVDENCRVHALNNLYVAGSGCYTTSAAPNPTLTLTALSLRLSDHLKEKVRNV